ncbi:N-acyl homoserine lactonase family protein [Parvularcula marina]|uniref:N-acyl homoserine lactonase family protein n=2 Tax=Parvularcula marina TaxID=2292771 RepID=A0A371RJX3_9PROT|nr:N-acyl homoserine lactonase family protein [Parvularcula marina]
MRKGESPMKSWIMLALLGTSMLTACGGKDDTNEPEQITEPPVVEEAAVTGVATALYVFDCGTIAISDLDVFASDGSYAGQTDTFTDSCFLIRHPKGDLLWDLGLPAALVGQEPQVNEPFTVSLETSLADQLNAIGVAPGDIDLVSISHSHFDHTGQPEAAGKALWLVHQAEYDHMFDAENPNDYSAFEKFDTKTFTEDYDVFGDGAVRIMSLPGHTPGHTALLVKMAETGPVLLSGDLYHRAESREGTKVPRFNTDEAMTRNSMDRFEAIAAASEALVIIQHEPVDVAKLPKPPEALK